MHDAHSLHRIRLLLNKNGEPQSIVSGFELEETKTQMVSRNRIYTVLLKKSLKKASRKSNYSKYA